MHRHTDSIFFRIFYLVLRVASFPFSRIENVEIKKPTCPNCKNELNPFRLMKTIGWWQRFFFNGGFLDSSGNIQSLEKGYIAGETDLFLPDGDQWFHLDDNTGTEKLYLVASREKIGDFSRRIKKLKSDGIGTIEKVFSDATIQTFSFEHQ